MKTCVWVGHLLLICSVMVASGCATQSSPQKVKFEARSEVRLWEGVAPGSEGRGGAEITGTQVEPDSQFVEAITFAKVSNINVPTITPYLPEAGKGTGAAVIVVPGGGHQFLAIEHEGYGVARELAARGVMAFVLKYRLAKEPNSPYKVDVHALMDIQRAIRLVRAHGPEWGVDSKRVGVMGFSAGGELSFLAATRFEKPVEGTHDAVDRLSCRPDFAALMYPGGLNGVGTMVLPKDMPPEFLACANNDKPVTLTNMANLYLRLKEMNVPAEMHIYNSGGHGFGIRPESKKPVTHWPDVFVDWLGDRGMLSGKHS